ncbi:hypothetical protein [Erythrobacter colymbi]|uniref:hypothetical protein n=1 Tax=Erythrobacter colymbi TaxID=1161202 RepID=UPI00117DB1AC|nr:hypothetical protein [Erythrobacter colymbi]
METSFKRPLLRSDFERTPVRGSEVASDNKESDIPLSEMLALVLAGEGRKGKGIQRKRADQAACSALSGSARQSAQAGGGNEP